MATTIELENGRRETELERCDRNLVELLQEVRIVQTGVQVLFGFLLALAFTSRFRTASAFERIDYFVTLLAAAAAAILLIAPTSYHRILFRLGDKWHLVRIANRLAIAGLVGVAISMVGSVMLIGDLLFGAVGTAATGLATTAAVVVTWYLLPWGRRRAVKSNAVAWQELEAECVSSSGTREAQL